MTRRSANQQAFAIGGNVEHSQIGLPLPNSAPGAYFVDGDTAGLALDEEPRTVCAKFKLLNAFQILKEFRWAQYGNLGERTPDGWTGAVGTSDAHGQCAQKDGNGKKKEAGDITSRPG